MAIFRFGGVHFECTRCVPTGVTGGVVLGASPVARRKGSTVPELISLDAAEQLSTGQVHDLYRDHVSRSQVSLMTTFGFGYRCSQV